MDCVWLRKPTVIGIIECAHMRSADLMGPPRALYWSQRGDRGTVGKPWDGPFSCAEWILDRDERGALEVGDDTLRCPGRRRGSHSRPATRDGWL